MTKWLTDNLGLKITALLLAVGIVWIKAQEKIDERRLVGVQVTVENYPINLQLPNNWNPPTVTLTVRGPKNTIDFIRPEQCSFRVNLSKEDSLEANASVTHSLTDAMFRTNLEPSDRQRISVVDDSIRPRQAAIHLIPWDIQKDQPSPANLPANPNQVTIPLYEIEKWITVDVPRSGTPTEELLFAGFVVDPSEILVTGKMEAVDRIKSVSTTMLDLTTLSKDTPPIYMPLQGMGIDYDVWPVQENVRGATVSLKIKSKGKK